MENNNNKKERQIARRREFGLFDPFFEDFFGFPDFKREFKELDRVMKTDVHEDEKQYHLEIELPGYDKGDINLDVNNGYLTIEAKHQGNNDEKDEKGNYIRRERFFGSCARTFYVGDIDENEIQASLDRGVLSISVPKEKKQETKKHIEIQ